MTKGFRGRGLLAAGCLALLGFFPAEKAAAPAAAGSAEDVSQPLLARSDFETGRAEGWAPRAPAIWRVGPQAGGFVYRLTAAGEPGKVRAPQAWSLLTGLDVAGFDFRGRMQCDADPANPHRDLCVLFHFRDPEHFLYVHFSASSDEAHNIIGLVDGKDRVKISREPAGKSIARLTDREFHAFRVTYDAKSGEIEACLDDLAAPILTATDRTFGHGLVGVGSFDDTGSFDDLELRGRRWERGGGFPGLPAAADPRATRQARERRLK